MWISREQLKAIASGARDGGYLTRQHEERKRNEETHEETVDYLNKQLTDLEANKVLHRLITMRGVLKETQEKLFDAQKNFHFEEQLNNTNKSYTKELNFALANLNVQNLKLQAKIIYLEAEIAERDNETK